LRWRGVVGELYLAPELDLATHKTALRALLELDPVTEQQIEYLLA